MKRFRAITIVVILAVGVSLVGAYAYLTLSYPGLFTTIGTSPLACPSSATATGQAFTITFSGQGLNGSRYAIPCPLMTVTKGQTITIHVVNNDRETHGLAITRYLANGVTLQPGQSKDVTFTADQVGSFTVYCNIGCFAHNYMQNGRLNVT